MNIKGEALWAQYQAAVELWPFITDIEREHGLPPFLLWAEASRETGMNRAYAEGRVHNDGTGWGLFGADQNWNDLDLPAFASDPRAQAALCARSLTALIRTHTDLVDAVNAYGPSWARGYEPENYGPDVLARAQYLANRAGGANKVTRIYTRAEWGAVSPTGITPAPSQNLGLGFHHLGDGWGPTGSLAESMAKMREIQAFHMGPARGWADFAYNWAFDHLGNIFEGRGLNRRNAANGGGTRQGYDANARWSSALYLAGSDGPDLTPAAQDAAWAIMAHCALVGAEWLGHDDFLSTECPGPDRRHWLDIGHPRGSTVQPVPIPEPQQEESDMYIHDGPDEVGGGIYVSDGDRAWGVPNEAFLVDYFFSGLMKHGGKMHADTFWSLRDRDGNPRSRSTRGLADDLRAEGAIEVNGDLCRTMDEVRESSALVEVGDPGCG